MKPLDSLADAWAWYEDTRLQLRLIERLARRYWDQLLLQRELANDEHFHRFQGPEMEKKAGFTLFHLDDLAIVVLFSVFEAQVRERVLQEIQTEEASLHHRAIKSAVQEAKEQIKEGSFFHVLQPYKYEHADLVEQVNQVRRYRNWVAHGRRGVQPEIVEPRTALDRLNRFLLVLQPQPSSTETSTP